MIIPNYLTDSFIEQQVMSALAEDVGTGDLSAKLCPSTRIQATLITREPGVLCGQPWINMLLKKYSPSIHCTWFAKDGDVLSANQPIFKWEGPASDLLTLERTALNFLQTLSGTATRTHEWAKLIAHTHTKLLDTRKTIPGLRLAQKYAVLCGGGHNHRLGLFDAILIKENHIQALGSISKALEKALALHTFVEIEVETFEQLNEALLWPVNRILLDNFSVADLKKAILQVNGRVELEASGNIHFSNLKSFAETGVNYISCGALTKHIQALDLSLRFD